MEFVALTRGRLQGGPRKGATKRKEISPPALRLCALTALLCDRPGTGIPGSFFQHSARGCARAGPSRPLVRGRAYARPGEPWATRVHHRALEARGLGRGDFLNGLLDASRVAIVGYSMGGYGALAPLAQGTAKGRVRSCRSPAATWTGGPRATRNSKHANATSSRHWWPSPPGARSRRTITGTPRGWREFAYHPYSSTGIRTIFPVPARCPQGVRRRRQFGAPPAGLRERAA